MLKQRIFYRNIYIVCIICVALFIAASLTSHAASVPDSKGQINSREGAYLRASSTTSSKQVAILQDNTALTIHNEVFVSKTSTSATNRWYYVTAKGKKGYVRADLVDNIVHGSIAAKVKYGINLRKGAGTGMSIVGTLSKNANVSVLMKASPVASAQGSNAVWYKVKSGSKVVYLCSSGVTLTGQAKPAQSASTTKTNTTVLSDAKFEAHMKKQGFPESYKPALRALHKAHPKWVFTAYKTNVTWSAALSKQTRNGAALIHKSLPSNYRKSGSKQVEPGWYNADSRVVAYYMDPRNFLNENNVYMFENLSYKPAYQTAGVVSNILQPSKLPAYGFNAKIFVNAGKKSNVSPVFLAARARQETGNGSEAIRGKTKLGKVYNPFNIGAFGGTNPLYNGLIYARAKGWTTPTKAVEGGAAEIAKNYINKGQYTLYYQRFNVRNGAAKVGTHQYMTNIMASYSESISTKNSYTKYGVNKQALVFEIPIYNSMPKSTKLP